MSSRSSPVNGGFEAANSEPAMRLTVRKDLFPEVRLPKLVPAIPEETTISDDLNDVSCVKLETDFEQSIDDIAKERRHTSNGLLTKDRLRHRKHKQHSRKDHDRFSSANGYIPSDRQKRKKSPDDVYLRTRSAHLQVKGGKNLNLVSSTKCYVEDDSSEDEVLKCSVKLPFISIPRQSGKPYSHELSQLSSKKKKSKERRLHVVTPCSGKPRSMLDICSSRSKKKKKSESTPTYHSQIVDTNKMKIKIKRSGIYETITPTPIADLGQRKSKKKRASSPAISESSGEEYDPTQGETAASMSVAAPKPRHNPPRTKKSYSTKQKEKPNKTDLHSRSCGGKQSEGPQSPWANAIPEEVLTKIFEFAVLPSGSLPTIVRISKVCRLWHNVSCRSQLWHNVDLALYTTDKCKTDYKLAWLLENRLSQCRVLNLAHWKVCNMSWVVACLTEYCPSLVELSLAGWSRLTPEQLYDLLQGLPKLKRLDLSFTSEIGGSGTCLAAASMTRIAENFGSRLTHLTLANNKFTSLQQILTSIGTYCLNLEVLDISSARATSHPAAVPLELLQKGCPKMRVFRAANAQLVLASATTAQQMECAGWSALEELSIAGEAATERVGVGEYRLGDEALSRLVRGATRLRLLDLRGLQRLTDSGLVRVPAWDLQHLFLGGCNVSRQDNACLELICEKWAHSLIELDLSWSSASRALDAAIDALADHTQSRLRVLNLCGSSVSLQAIKKVLRKCSQLDSINLSSCRALPRGMKRLYTGKELQDLKDSLDPEKIKTQDEKADTAKKKKDVKKHEADSKTDSETSSHETSLNTSSVLDSKDGSEHLLSLNVNSVISPQSQNKQSDIKEIQSPSSKITETIAVNKNDQVISMTSIPYQSTPKHSSPVIQSNPDSSSTPRGESERSEMGSPQFSPVARPDSQALNSPEVNLDSNKSSWNVSHFKTTPSYKPEASPLGRPDNKIKPCNVIEQCSPTTSQDNKQSPETIQGMKQDIKNPNNWNYSPMPRQEGQFSAQPSPYSTQPSPAHPSPYSTQPSPYSTQPSPYSSQPSPYSAQPSPDTSQIVKSDLQKSTGSWSTGNFSPMTKHPAPFSPHPSTHTSPDPGLGVKNDSMRSNPSKTPGQFSPMSRQDRIHQSPYSPRPSVDSAYSNKKSPGMGNFSPLMRSDTHLPSPDGGQVSRSSTGGRQQDLYARSMNKAPDLMQSATAADLSSIWGLDQYVQSSLTSGSVDQIAWATPSFSSEPVLASRTDIDNIPSILNTPPAHPWSSLPPFTTSVQRHNDNMSDPWTLGQFRVEPPHSAPNTFTEQSVHYSALGSHMGHPSQIPQSYLDESYTEVSRVD